MWSFTHSKNLKENLDLEIEKNKTELKRIKQVLVSVSEDSIKDFDKALRGQEN